jgi:hypothetical protein
MALETPRTLNGRRETLTVQALRAAAADRRATELESELQQERKRFTELQAELQLSHEQLAESEAELERSREGLVELERELRQSDERLAHEHNKAVSLERSLALKTDESLRLRQRMTEVSADLEQKHAEVAQTCFKLTAAELQRAKVNEEKQAEISALAGRFKVVSMNAERAERLLQEIQQRLLKKEQELQELKAECTVELLKRDAALAQAEQRMRSLANLFSELETTVGVRWQSEGELISAAPIFQVAKGSASHQVSFGSGVLDRELAEDAWLFEFRAEHSAARGQKPASPLISQDRRRNDVKTSGAPQRAAGHSRTRTPRRGDGRGVRAGA